MDSMGKEILWACAISFPIFITSHGFNVKCPWCHHLACQQDSKFHHFLSSFSKNPVTNAIQRQGLKSIGSHCGSNTIVLLIYPFCEMYSLTNVCRQEVSGAHWQTHKLAGVGENYNVVDVVRKILEWLKDWRMSWISVAHLFHHVLHIYAAIW